MEPNDTQVPEKFRPYLGDYGGHLKDHASKEVIGFGYPIIGTLGEDMWKELAALGKMVFDPKPNAKIWYFIKYYMTREQAIAKYGEAKDEYGPRGGWKSVTFGTTKFDNAIFKPETKQVVTTCPLDGPKVVTVRLIE